jgi:uncharacterized repeat protein (TIGR03803 family)
MTTLLNARTLAAMFPYLVTSAIGLLGPSTVAHAQDFTVIHDFNLYNPDGTGSAEGDRPVYLIQTSDGAFYGTTINGGTPDFSNGFGNIFRMMPDGAITVLESTCPRVRMIQGSDGNLYAPGFRMSLDGTCTLLHAFTGSAVPLVEGRDGNFYGTTTRDGDFNLGTIYQMTPSGVVTILHSFTDMEGIDSIAPLVQASDGDFYGTTASGGPHGGGTVFKMAEDGTFTVLHGFGHTIADGIQPQAGLLQTRTGIFYGTTIYGGAFGAGTVFSMTPDGTVTIIHSFTGGSDGGTPIAPLIQTKDGRIYGISRDPGAVFQVVFGVVVVMHTLDTRTEGFDARSIIQASDGNLYGTAGFGGAHSGGTVFRLNIRSPCVDALGLTYEAGTLDLQFALKSSTPGLWSTWLASQNGITPLWSVSIPKVSPKVSFNVSIPSFPHVGTVGVLTALVTSTFDFCGDWKTIDTGGMMPRARTPESLRR